MENGSCRKGEIGYSPESVSSEEGGSYTVVKESEDENLVTPSAEPSSTALYIDAFIKKIHDGDLVYDHERAEKALYVSATGETGWLKREKPVSIIDTLSFALTDYQQHKEMVERWGATREHLRTLYTATQHAFLWINKAKMNGVVKENPNLAKQLADCREENANLRKEIDGLIGEKSLHARISGTGEFTGVEEAGDH